MMERSHAPPTQKTTSDSFKVGTEVEAQWDDGYYYKARIKRKTSHSYIVIYSEFGDEEEVPIDRVRPLEIGYQSTKSTPYNVFCDNDEKEMAIYWCEQCQMNFCADCDDVFHRSKIYQSHERISLEEYLSTESLPQSKSYRLTSYASSFNDSPYLNQKVLDDPNVSEMLTQLIKSFSTEYDTNDDDGRNIEYHIIKFNQYGKQQDRTIVLSIETKKFILRDSKTKKQKKELKIGEIMKIEIPANESNKCKAPLSFVFSSRQRGFTVDFHDVDERLHFIQQMVHLNSKLKHADLFNKENPQDILRFSIKKTTKGGITKARTLTLLTKGKKMQVFGHAKTPEKEVLISQFEKVIRGNDKKKVDLYFKDGHRSRYIFQDAAYRERFLGRMSQFLQHDLSNPQRLTSKTMSIFVTTWNVAESKPTTSKIYQQWLGKPQQYDLYSISFQENSKKQGKWIKDIHTYICGKGGLDSYVVVGKIHIMHIVLIVFVKERFSQYLKLTKMDSIACGIGDVIGNKGGVIIAFSILDTSFCIVNCHLAARAERVEKRRIDFKRIVREMDVLNKYHHVFWAGDLNYRITKDWDEVLELIKKKDWVTLRSADQLSHEKEKLNVFAGFREGALEFCPPYRWDRQKNIASNKRRQPPSYTDRILWRSFPNMCKELKLEKYNSCRKAFGSDHRPVFSTFTLQLRSPYEGTKLYHSSNPDASRYEHCEIFITDLIFSYLGDQNLAEVELKLTFSSSILDVPVTTSPMRPNENQQWVLNQSLGTTSTLPQLSPLISTKLKIIPFIYDDEILRTSSITITVTRSQIKKDDEELSKFTEKKDQIMDNLISSRNVVGTGVISIESLFDDNCCHTPILFEGQRIGSLICRLTKKTCGEERKELDEEDIEYSVSDQVLLLRKNGIWRNGTIAIVNEEKKFYVCKSTNSKGEPRQKTVPFSDAKKMLRKAPNPPPDKRKSREISPMSSKYSRENSPKASTYSPSIDDTFFPVSTSTQSPLPHRREKNSPSSIDPKVMRWYVKPRHKKNYSYSLQGLSVTNTGDMDWDSRTNSRIASGNNSLRNSISESNSNMMSINESIYNSEYSVSTLGVSINTTTITTSIAAAANTIDAVAPALANAIAAAAAAAAAADTADTAATTATTTAVTALITAVDTASATIVASAAIVASTATVAAATVAAFAAFTALSASTIYVSSSRSTITCDIISFATSTVSAAVVCATSAAIVSAAASASAAAAAAFIASNTAAVVATAAAAAAAAAAALIASDTATVTVTAVISAVTAVTATDNKNNRSSGSHNISHNHDKNVNNINNMKNEKKKNRKLSPENSTKRSSKTQEKSTKRSSKTKENSTKRSSKTRPAPRRAPPRAPSIIKTTATKTNNASKQSSLRSSSIINTTVTKSSPKRAPSRPAPHRSPPRTPSTINTTATSITIQLSRQSSLRQTSPRSNRPPSPDRRAPAPKRKAPKRPSGNVKPR